MKRLVWGLILIVIGLAAPFAPANRAKPAGDVIPAVVLLLGGGGALTYFGARYLKRRRLVATAAFQMLRDKAEINTAEISRSTAINELAVRELVAHAQKKGLIPPNAKLI